MRKTQWVFEWNRAPFSRTARIDTRLPAHSPPPSELGRGPRRKVCVSLSFVCLRVFGIVCVCPPGRLQGSRERSSNREGRELAGERAKVLITYRSNLADDFLKMQRAAQRERGEGGVLFKSPLKSHPCFTKYLLPILCL